MHRLSLVECPTIKEIPMYDQSKLSELIRFARVEVGSIVIDVYPGDGDWTRIFSDVVRCAAVQFHLVRMLIDGEMHGSPFMIRSHGTRGPVAWFSDTRDFCAASVKEEFTGIR
jgi:hypothetical protein